MRNFVLVVTSLVIWQKCLVLSNVLTKNDDFRLDIVHYNDFHDRFEESSILYSVCIANDSTCIGGFPRLYHGIMTLMAEKPRALLLNAGDTFQGTYWYTLLKWNITQKFINAFPNDAHALGNHEFDDGIAGLVPYLKSLSAPVLAANVDISREPSLDGLIQPYTIVMRDGKKIGIIGLITPMTSMSSNSEKVIFLDPFITVERVADKLVNEGIDLIIVLSHCGLSVDEEIARVAGNNIDVIVGGHSHSLLWNGDAPSKEPVAGSYPIVVESRTKIGHKVLVVTASAFTKYLGNLTVYFDRTGEVTRYEGTPLFLNRSIPEDKEMMAILRPYADRLHSLVNKVVGESTEALLVAPCGSQECAFGNLVADSFLNATKELRLSNLTHVTIIARNNIRVNIPKGAITRAAVINALPFTNKVETCVIKGRYIVEALAHSMTIPWRTKPFNGPLLAQVSGMRIVLNASAVPPNVVSVHVDKGNKFEVLKPDDDYQLTVMSFVSRGGNGFKINEQGRHFVTVGIDREILERYIKQISPVKPILEKRLIVHN